MRPNFFIVGAPKCGTTSLADWLSAHPDVFMPALKEPHFFSDDMKNRTVTNQSEYESLFRGAGSARAVGEASTWYLYSSTAARNIEAAVKDAKYIVLTRDPAAMAVSLYHHNRRMLAEDSETFEMAWSLQSARKNSTNIPPNCLEPAALQYKDACSLRTMTSRLLQTVDPRRVFGASLEDIRNDPRRVYVQVLNFLGLPDDGRSDFPLRNPAREPKSRALQVLIRRAARVKKALGIYHASGISRLNERAIEKAVVSEQAMEEVTRSLAQETVIWRDRERSNR